MNSINISRMALYMTKSSRTLPSSRKQKQLALRFEETRAERVERLLGTDWRRHVTTAAKLWSDAEYRRATAFATDGR